MDAAIVPNFIIVDTHYQRLPDLLVGDVSGFAASHEYTAIIGSERDRPEPVFAALVRLCIRLHKQEMAGPLGWRDRATLEQIHGVFERIARDDIASRKFALVTAMFDALAEDDGWSVLTGLKKALGPSTRHFFDLWFTLAPASDHDRRDRPEDPGLNPGA